jgi:hypothetical protein
MPWSRYDVFLSYSRADKERVQPLLDELTQLGYRVFFDARSIPYSEKWKEVLERSIRASRMLVLCWSEPSSSSAYVAYERHRAEAVHIRVFPWMLDGTPLPPLLEVQAIKEPDGAKVADLLRPYLGWTLTRRRALQGLIAGVLAIALGITVWFIWFRSWQFQGEIDDLSHNPIAGVEVDATAYNRVGKPVKLTYITGPNGRYFFLLPQPKQQDIHIIYHKVGYVGGEVNVPPGDGTFDAQMRLEEPVEK